MKNNSTSLLTILLTVTAIALAVALLSTTQQPVQAAMNASAPPYTMITAGAAGDEALMIIDNFSQKMLVYRLKDKELQAIAVMSPKDFGTWFERPPTPK